MSELTARAEEFKAAICGFIEARREAKLKGKDNDPEAASTYVYATWLTDAASRAHNLRVVTHPIKFTHSAIKGATSIRYGPSHWASRSEIGTHSLGSAFEEDFAISDAKHLDVRSFLMEVNFEGRPLLEWVCLDDVDLCSALHSDPSTARELMELFQHVVEADREIKSSALAKQVYWLHGTDPAQDDDYHLLQPMFSSSLENAVHREIRNTRSAAFEARGTKSQKPTYANHHTYPNVVARTLGGSNAQNISPMNKARGGLNYLLSSLPPPAWRPREYDLRKHETAFDEFLWFDDVRSRVEELARYLNSVKEMSSTKEIRDKRDSLTHAIVEKLVFFGTTIRGYSEAGWTRDKACRLPFCEQLWLDPDRNELPPRDDSQHPHWREEDEAFIAAYYRGNWVDEVAERFADWLNAQLHRAGLVAVSLPERKLWASQAIADVAWPMPMHRRATGGAP